MTADAGGSSGGSSSGGGGPSSSSGTSSSGTSSGGASSGASSSSGTVATDSGTTTNPSGTQFPFPQNRRSPNCAYPTAASPSQITAAYGTWKSAFVVTDAAGNSRVKDPNDTRNPNRTVSEGIGYGMLIAVYMADQALFDSLWSYEQVPSHLDKNGLMNWLVTASDTVAGTGGATDADEDMAWALVMADKQWPNQGYIDKAKAQIDLVSSLELNPNTSLVKWGDNSNTPTVHPDYFSPAYYRVFGAVTGNTSGWNGAISAGYALLAASHNATTGLVPDLCMASGAPTANARDAVYGYDACRTPWRLGIDWCFNASADAHGILTLMASYFAGVGAAGIRGPVALDGTTSSTAMPYANPEFTGPAGIAGMVSSSASGQTFLDQAFSRTFNQVQQSSAMPNYFGASVGLISMLVMSGNFVDYTQP